MHYFTLKIKIGRIPYFVIKYIVDFPLRSYLFINLSKYQITLQKLPVG